MFDIFSIIISGNVFCFEIYFIWCWYKYSSLLLLLFVLYIFFVNLVLTYNNLSTIVGSMGFPGGSDGKEYACDAGKAKN